MITNSCFDNDIFIKIYIYIYILKKKKTILPELNYDRT